MVEEIKEKRIKVIWGSDENLPALYANYLFISHAGETEFHLIFGHISPPLTVGLEESELPDSLKIKPVAKIVISPEAMRQFTNVINENLEKYESNLREKKNANAH